MRVFFSLLVICLSLALASCGSSQTYQTAESISDPILPADGKLSRFQTDINHILNLISHDNLVAARQAYNSLSKRGNSSDDNVLQAYTQARLALAEKNLDGAYSALNNAGLSSHLDLARPQSQLHTGLLNASVLESKGLYMKAAITRIHIHALITEKNIQDTNNTAVWKNLNRLSGKEIDIALQNVQDSKLLPWLALNDITQNPQQSFSEKMAGIDRWQKNNPAHDAMAISIVEKANLNELALKQQQKIAVILPFKGKHAAIAEAIRDGLMQSYYQSSYNSEIRFYAATENDKFINVYQQAIKDGANLVIGPLFKNQLEELYQLGTLPVDTIALNKLNLPGKPSRLLEFSLAPEDEIISMVEYGMGNNLHNAFVIAQTDEFSQKNASLFTQAWKGTGNKIVNQHHFGTTTDLAIALEQPLNLSRSRERIDGLQNLLGVTLEANVSSRTDIDTIAVFAKPDSTGEINALLDVYLHKDIVKYSNSSIYRGFPDKSDNSLNGMIFTDIPLVLYTTHKLGQKYAQSPLVRMYAFGMDAFQLSRQVAGSTSLDIQGATGHISLNNGELVRKTSFAIFDNGIARPLADITLNQ